MNSGDTEDPAVNAAVQKAIELITDGARIGLGSGRAAALFIAKLGVRRSEGLHVSGVATSKACAIDATRAGIPLFTLGEGGPLDLTVDGADEVAPNLDLVKGFGGAMVRERIVAAHSRSQVIIVGAGKLVHALGERGRLPVEATIVTLSPVREKLELLGLAPTLRADPSGLRPLITESGNYILDCSLGAPIGDGRLARELEQRLLAIDGVVDTGLFLGTADRVFVGYRDGHVNLLSRVEGTVYYHPA